MASLQERATTILPRAVYAKDRYGRAMDGGDSSFRTRFLHEVAQRIEHRQRYGVGFVTNNLTSADVEDSLRDLRRFKARSLGIGASDSH